ncbi:hypothetical protein QYE76_015422 [Lolium multiflorum]|uniref:Reverse transcriptase n=1 Tax=Lolium multiflorum TaxID=4521 RepID=A0AAD8U2H8_LOLMU|nr:hypothetical protein QYE76_015422 [Lolium multiflorum]
MIASAWNSESCSTRGELEGKINGLAGKLRAWGRDTFGHVRREIQVLRRDLSAMRAAPGRVGPGLEEIKVVERLVELQGREETMWRQRSRVQWLAEGDRNTKFFHLRASKRKKKNRINRIARSDGSFTEDQLARAFYGNLYTSEGTSGMEEVLSSVPVSVTQAMNDMLTAPYAEEEVKATLFQMYPLKALGPDGFPAQFFQKHWDLCGEEVTKAVLRILRGEENPESTNKTFILMIPKIASPTELDQFRPISLCNILENLRDLVKRRLPLNSEGTASAQSPPPAVSPKNKRKRNSLFHTSKPEEAVPSRQKAAYDPYLEALISSDDEEEVPAFDVAARMSTSHTLVVSETPVEGEQSSPPQQNVGASTPPSSPLVPSPKRARTETISEPTLQLSSSSNPLLDDPMIKELIRIGAQFIGYREYASKTEAVTRCSGEDGGDDDDDDGGDGDDVQLDDDDDGVDFPLREGISPADSCPPESSFLSCSPPAEAAVTLRDVPSGA